jgi:hypothetical protein
MGKKRRLIMIVRNAGLFLLALIIPATAVALPSKKGRTDASSEILLTPVQAERLLASVDALLLEMRECNDQNRAPRPGALPCDPAYPGCSVCDLTGVLEQLCLIQNELLCICAAQASCCDVVLSCCDVVESISDVLGECTDESVLLPLSLVDKSDIDDLCLSVISLLKTILLEIRGEFLVV